MKRSSKTLDICYTRQDKKSTMRGENASAVKNRWLLYWSKHARSWIR